jgi:ketosteroid isomerase-like protein
MSQENVERVHRGFDAFNRRDLDAFLALCDPEIEIVTRFAVERGGSYRGHEGVRAWWDDLLRVFPDFNIELVEVRDLGDVTVGSGRIRGRGVGSEVPFEERVWAAGKWRDGKLVWWQNCGSEAEALETAGLSG